MVLYCFFLACSACSFWNLLCLPEPFLGRTWVRKSVVHVRFPAFQASYMLQRTLNCTAQSIHAQDKNTSASLAQSILAHTIITCHAEHPVGQSIHARTISTLRIRWLQHVSRTCKGSEILVSTRREGSGLALQDPAGCRVSDPGRVVTLSKSKTNNLKAPKPSKPLNPQS